MPIHSFLAWSPYSSATIKPVVYRGEQVPSDSFETIFGDLFSGGDRVEKLSWIVYSYRNDGVFLFSFSLQDTINLPNEFRALVCDVADAIKCKLGHEHYFVSNSGDFVCPIEVKINNEVVINQATGRPYTEVKQLTHDNIFRIINNDALLCKLLSSKESKLATKSGVDEDNFNFPDMLAILHYRIGFSRMFEKFFQTRRRKKSSEIKSMVKALLFFSFIMFFMSPVVFDVIGKMPNKEIPPARDIIGMVLFLLVLQFFVKTYKLNFSTKYKGFKILFLDFKNKIRKKYVFYFIRLYYFIIFSGSMTTLLIVLVTIFNYFYPTFFSPCNQPDEFIIDQYSEYCRIKDVYLSNFNFDWSLESYLGIKNIASIYSRISSPILLAFCAYLDLSSRTYVINENKTIRGILFYGNIYSRVVKNIFKTYEPITFSQDIGGFDDAIRILEYIYHSDIKKYFMMIFIFFILFMISIYFCAYELWIL